LVSIQVFVIVSQECWLQLRFYCNSTAIRLCSTYIRPQFDRATTDRRLRPYGAIEFEY